MNTRNKKSNNRIYELDALRALAAINLMLFHYTHVYSVKHGFSSPLGFEFPWGKYGVQLFFMLSGVVNALTILKKRDVGAFLSARCLRILPCYYIVIAFNLVLLGLLPLSNGPQWTWSQLLANLTVMPNLFGFECFEPVMWTLQVEVLFYGLLILLFAKGWLDKPLAAIVAGLVICVAGCWASDALRHYLASDSKLLLSVDFARQLFLLDYFPLFAVGILLHDIWVRVRSEANSQIPSIENTYAMAGSLLGILACLTAFHCIDNHGHNPLVSLGLTALLAMSLFQWLPPLRYKPLVFISGISYMLYLLHDNFGTVLIYWMNNSLGLPPAICFALALPAAFAVATLATYGLERPLTRFLRQRFLSKGSGAEAISVTVNPVGRSVAS